MRRFFVDTFYWIALTNRRDQWHRRVQAFNRALTAYAFFTTDTNVPHLVVHHSPTGYEWGYGGSGPADLALNILEWQLRREGYRGDTIPCFEGRCFRGMFGMRAKSNHKP